MPKRSKRKMIPRAKIVFTILATLCCATMLAIPAKRGQWKTITLSDGRQVRVELRGDERAHWWEDSLHQRYVLCGMRNVECGMRNDTETREETRGMWNVECGVRNDTEIWEMVEDSDWSKRYSTRRYSHSTFHIPQSSFLLPRSIPPLFPSLWRGQRLPPPVAASSSSWNFRTSSSERRTTG